MAPNDKRPLPQETLWSRIDTFKRRQDSAQDLSAVPTSQQVLVQARRDEAPDSGQDSPAPMFGGAPAPGQDLPAPGPRPDVPAPQPGRFRSAAGSQARQPDPVVPMEEESLPESAGSMSHDDLEQRAMDVFEAADVQDDDLRIVAEHPAPEAAPNPSASDKKRARAEKKKKDAEKRAAEKSDRSAERGGAGLNMMGVPRARGRPGLTTGRGVRGGRGGRGGMESGPAVLAASQAWQSLSPHRGSPRGARASPSAHRSLSPPPATFSFSDEQPSGSGRPGVGPGNPGSEQVDGTPAAQKPLNPEAGDHPLAAREADGSGDSEAAGERHPVPDQADAQVGAGPEQRALAGLPLHDLQLARLMVILTHLYNVSCCYNDSSLGVWAHRHGERAAPACGPGSHRCASAAGNNRRPAVQGEVPAGGSGG